MEEERLYGQTVSTLTYLVPQVPEIRPYPDTRTPGPGLGSRGERWGPKDSVGRKGSLTVSVGR